MEDARDDPDDGFVLPGAGKFMHGPAWSTSRQILGAREEREGRILSAGAPRQPEHEVDRAGQDENII